MGNRIIVKRIKGITQYYAKNHIQQYKKGDFLNIVTDFDNPYDHNALALYDMQKNKLGYIDRGSNVEIYQIIKNNDYFCMITSVYVDNISPSIEYEIVYKTIGYNFEVSEDFFDRMLAKYNHSTSIAEEAANSFESRENIEHFLEINFKKFEAFWSPANNVVKIGVIAFDGGTEYFTYSLDEMYEDPFDEELKNLDINKILGFVVFSEDEENLDNPCAIIVLKTMDEALLVRRKNGGILTYENIDFEEVNVLFSCITRTVSYLQNSNYSLELQNRFVEFAELGDHLLFVDWPVDIDGFGESIMKILCSNTIKRVFGIQTSDYKIIFTNDGGINYCVPITEKYTIFDKTFVDYCIERFEEVKYADVFLKPMNFGKEPFVYAVYSDFHTIDNFKKMKKFMSQDAITEEKAIDMMKFLVQDQLHKIVNFLQSYIEEFMKDYE